MAAGMDPDSARIVADKAARALAAQYGGHRVYIPLADDKRNARDRAIRVAWGEGKSIRAIARQFRMSKSGVHAVLLADPSHLLT